MTLPAPNLPPVQHFNDDLASRIFPMRFRRIGSPFAFLNEVGVVPILEYIYKGNLLIDVAEVLNVSMTVLNTWVENEGHAAAIEEAEKLSAEGYLAEGMRRLRCAENQFELKRAQEMIKHAQFMASKKNKKVYGAVTEQQGGAGVSYVFNINGNISAPQELKDVIKTVEQVVEDVPQVRLDLSHLLKPDPDMPIGLLLSEDKLDIGPFYEAQEPDNGD